MTYIGEGYAQNNLVAGWHLNGNSNDFSGNNNHGTDTAITYSLANGKFNRGAGFNGSSSKIVLGTSSTLNPTNITCAAWFKYTSQSDYGSIISRWDTVGGINTRSYLINLDYTMNKSYFQISVDGTNAYNVISLVTHNDSKWHFAVGTFDGSNIRLYIDGNIQGTTALSGSIKSSPNNQTGIGAALGRSGDAINGVWNGAIDEVQIYNVAKDARWVRQQFAWGTGKFL